MPLRGFESLSLRHKKITEESSFSSVFLCFSRFFVCLLCFYRLMQLHDFGQFYGILLYFMLSKCCHLFLLISLSFSAACWRDFLRKSV